MSVIQSIRDRAAWIVSVAIAVALIAFIVQDAFHNGNLFHSSSTTMGVVNGTKISAVDFEERYKRAEEAYRQQGYPINDMMRNSIREGLWSEYVDDAIMNDRYENIGITVQDNELSDILYGNNPPRDLRQQFTDPKTGMYDANAAAQQIQALKRQKNTPQYESFFHQYLPALRKQREQEKYISLLSNTVYVPKWMAEKINANNSQKASISYVNVPYSTISDSAVKVSDEAIKNYVDNHKDEYHQEASRSIEYVSFNAGPTREDSAAILSQVSALKNEFSTTKDVASFLVRNGSETPYNEIYELKSKIQSPYADSITALNEGGVAGPFIEGGNYVLVRVMGKRNLPDSVKVRHILIKTAGEKGQPILADSTAKKRIDSIAAAIHGGANFDSMVVKYSDDEGSKTNGGEYEFSYTQFTGLSKEFAEVAFYGVTGDKKVVKVDNAAYGGYHYIEVLNQRKFEPAYEIAKFSKAIVPSDETINRENGLASQFAAQSRTKQQFVENARKNNYNILVAADLKPLDDAINGLGSSRELVKWVFDSKAGAVAESPYQVEDKFVVPLLTQIYKEGTMPVEKARPLVENLLRNKEKSKQIIAKIGSASSLDAVAKATGQQVVKADSVMFNSMFIPNVGQEPKVIGASFNQAYQTKLSDPIVGNGGVFVLKIENISAVSTVTDASQQKQQIEQSHKRALSDPRVLSEILKKTVKITDNRYKFF